MRLLFITSNRIGDAVLSTGLLAHLIERHPGIRITVAAGPASAPLFGPVPGLERVLIMRKNRYRLHWFSLWRQIVGRRWDMAVDLRRSVMLHLIFARDRRIVPKPDAPMHRIKLLGRMVDREADPPAPTLWWRRPHDENAQSLLGDDGPVLGIGPTANWQGKIWPAENFADLIGRLTAADGPFPAGKVAIFGGPDERLQANPVLHAVPPERRVDLVGKVDLPTAAACLSRCALYIGNDSGLMHMAAATGIPTLGLFGPSKMELYAPWGRNAVGIRTPESFEELTGGPDYDRHTVGSLMTGLTAERVEEAALNLLAEARAPSDR